MGLLLMCKMNVSTYCIYLLTSTLGILLVVEKAFLIFYHVIASRYDAVCLKATQNVS